MNNIEEIKQWIKNDIDMNKKKNEYGDSPLTIYMWKIFSKLWNV